MPPVWTVISQIPEGMHGKHASVINPNNKLPVTCTNCHGQPSPQHREGVKDVMRFNEPMYKVGEQNSVCMSCHLPEQLQKRSGHTMST